MASVTMTASFLGGTTLARGSSATAQRRCVVASAAVRASEGEKEKVSVENGKEGSSGRRNLVFGAAAAAVAACSVASSGMKAIAEEPKPGTPEAKKIYAPVCVTMPTAKICRK